MSQEKCIPRYIVFGGSCILTAARCLIEMLDGSTDASILRRSPIPWLARITLVSCWSPGMFPLAYSILLCREHSDLPGDITFRDKLLDVLIGQ